MYIGKIGCDYLFKISTKVDMNMVEDNNKKIDKIAELEKKIKELEHRERYSKNQMEKRNLRSQIGQLRRELTAAKKKKKGKQ